MRWRTVALTLLATAAVCFTGNAEAARWRVGVFFGGPSYYAPGPYYYAPPPYYYPPPVVYSPPVVIQDDPDVYIERSQNESAAPQMSSGTRWYCASSRSYYPDVKGCSSGWREVPGGPPAR